MGKFRPGIPQGFDLDVPEVKPVSDLGDYLDEPGASPVRAVARRPAPSPVDAQPSPPGPAIRLAPPAVPDAAPAPARPWPAGLPTEPPAPAGGVVAFPAPARSEPRDEAVFAAPKGKAPRREISMTPEALRMSDELLDMVQRATGQRDAKANELFHAVILLLYEARGELELHRVPRRGKWGTPTARAFPVALKSAFLEAVLARARKDAGRAGG